jgi:hypothetical protein
LNCRFAGAKSQLPKAAGSHTLQRYSSLTTANWTPGRGISNDGTKNFITITSPAGNLFFGLWLP